VIRNWVDRPVAVAKIILTSRVAGVIVLGLYLLYVAVLGRAAWRNPDYEWDMLAYVATVLSFEETESRAVHNEAYAYVRQH